MGIYIIRESQEKLLEAERNKKFLKMTPAQLEAAGYERRPYGNGNFVGWGYFAIPWYKKLWRRLTKRKAV